MKKKAKKGEWNFFIKSFKNSNVFWILMFDVLFIFLFYVGSLVLNLVIERFKSSLLDIQSKISLAMPTTEAEALALQQQLQPLKSILYWMLAAFILFIIYLYFSWTLSRGLIWSKILKKKFTSKFWMRFSLFNIFWLLIVIIPVSVIFFLLFLMVSKSIFISAGANYIYLLFVGLLFFILWLIYIHFTNLFYYKFTETNKIFKAIGTAFKVGILRIKKFLLPYLFVFLTIITISIVSLIFKIFPKTIEVTISLVLMLAFLAWSRLYLASVIEKASKKV